MTKKKYEVLLCDAESGILEEFFIEETSVWTVWDEIIERDLPSGVKSVSITLVVED